MEKKITAKEYLSQIYAIDRRIKRLQQMRAQIREEMYAVRSPGITPDRVQTSATGDSLERLIAKVDSVERNIVTELQRLIERRTVISGQIDDMQDERYKAILHARYVMCWKWEKVARELHYSDRNVYQLHGEALAAFDKQYLQ